MDIAWKMQSDSLIEVQKKGSGLERQIRDILDWDQGNVVYDHKRNYKLQVDNVYPSLENPGVMASVTYTEPNTKGHSNENKLQLKVGELALFKNSYPSCKIILILGGSKESWLPYVLKAFEFFFDEVVYIWDEQGIERLLEIKKDPQNSIKLKHESYWNKVRQEWDKINYFESSYSPPCGLLRYKVLDKIKEQIPSVDHPDLINTRIAALCFHRAKRKNGKEWINFRSKNWNAIEQSRSYFNPLESVVELSLSDSNFKFEGGIAQDVKVPSFLHDLGMENTLLSEDFVLFSKKYNKNVYIQCKASGGGRKQHGKNIQNRTKEQISRGLLYRSNIKNSVFLYGDKNYIWISVLDGNWGVTKRSPLKYVHMLQTAGYDHFIGSEELVDIDLNPLKGNQNPLLRLLKSLNCELKENR